MASALTNNNPNINITIQDTVWIAAEALSYFASQVRFLKQFVDSKIFLITPDQLVGFEPRFHLALDRVSGGNRLGRIVSCELATQLINRLQPLDPSANSCLTTFQFPPPSPGIQAKRLPVGQSGEFYEYYQGRLCVALALAGNILSRQLDIHTDLDRFLHGSFLDSSRLHLIADPGSWIFAVQRTAVENFWIHGDAKDFYIQTGAFLDSLAETIALRPYYAGHHHVLRWIRILDSTHSHDRLYTQRLKSIHKHPNMPRQRGNSVSCIVCLIGTTHTGIRRDRVDTKKRIECDAITRGCTDWSSCGNKYVSTSSYTMRKTLLPLENSARVVELLIAQSILDEKKTLHIQESKTTAPIEAGISSLWRTNPLEMQSQRVSNAPVAHADLPGDMHSRKKVLTDILGKVKTDAMDRQTDGIVRQKAIASGAMFCKDKPAGATCSGSMDATDVLAAFDEDKELEQRTQEIEKLVGSPLQAVRMSDQEWQLLISDTVGQLHRQKATVTINQEQSERERGVHRPVPGLTEVVFY
jgi:hypothetical protein